MPEVNADSKRSRHPSPPAQSLTHPSPSRLRDKDPRAWARLVELYGPVIYHFCRNRNIPGTDAQDIVQNVFLAVATGLESFSRDGRIITFHGWLWKIVRCRVVDVWREDQGRPDRAIGGSSDHQRWPPLIDGYAPSSASASFDPADDTQLRRYLRRRGLDQAIEVVRARVEATTLQAFLRVVGGEQAVEDVAKDLRLKPGAVHSAVHRMKKQLRHALKDLDYSYLFPELFEEECRGS
jgi:RNA polymerase sigma-70 factor (ECF subfamily)